MKLIIDAVTKIEGYEYETIKEQANHIKEMEGKGYQLQKIDKSIEIEIPPNNKITLSGMCVFSKETIKTY